MRRFINPATVRAMFAEGHVGEHIAVSIGVVPRSLYYWGRRNNVHITFTERIWLVDQTAPGPARPVKSRTITHAVMPRVIFDPPLEYFIERVDLTVRLPDVRPSAYALAEFDPALRAALLRRHAEAQEEGNLRSPPK